jgi:CheY-like chemotaxis protein/anti-sigma regulatory factor (Ser/Thr protein kinase)
VSSVLEGVMSTAQGLAKDKELHLSLDIPRDGLPLVWADQSRVRQVLLNLLSNAVKFTPGGGSIAVRAAVQDGMVSISVQDSGIGIKPEHQGLVFEEFRQVDSDLNRQYQGTGLGLPICKRLIQMHGGTLTLESVPGEGSTFTFTLPIAQMPTPLPGREAAPTQGHIAAPTGPHGLVVVVDDDPDAQSLLRHTLENAGWQVREVLESQRALEVIQETKPDLVVLDIQMHPLDGWEVLRQLRADPALTKLPVVICSVVDPVQGQMGIVNGIQGWVVKPVERQEFLTQVERVTTPPAQILVVDDEEDSRLVVRSILEQSGWRVIEARDGEEALACLAEREPDLIVLDLMMPRVDGFEVLRRLGTMVGREHIPVIVVTAKDLTVEESQWLATHTQGYFQKVAFPITNFPAIVRALVGPHTTQQEPTNGMGSSTPAREESSSGER